MIIGSCSLALPEYSTLGGNQDCLMILLSAVLQTKAVSYQHNESWINRVCVVLDCRVRVICYGGLRWTPWTPWGSWLWPVRPADSPPHLPPTPHPPSPQTITTPPTPCPAAGAALTATGASEASAVAGAGVNVEKQMEDALSSDQCSAELTSLSAQRLGSWLSKLRWRCWAQCERVSVKLSFWL